MGKKLNFCLLFSLILFFSLNAHAKGRPGAAYLGLVGGGYTFDGEADLGQGTLAGLKFGYEFRGKKAEERLGLEGVFNLVETESDADGSKVNAYLFRLDAVYPVLSKGDWIPFFAVGAGGIYIDDDVEEVKNPLFAYGGGLKYYIDNYLVVRADLRHLLVFDTEERMEDFEYTLGITYIFGQEARKKPVPPKDSDRDGVQDSRDRCPETPAVFKVDRKGCPINPPDGDEDGVPDYLDQCADTPKGAEVDEGGCLPDGDKDGVPDALDECPTNPSGFKVDKTGCISMN